MMKYLLICLWCLLVGMSVAQGPVKVETVKTPNGWQLLRGGEPYYIRGAGGTARMDVIVECGGNSVRTWGLEEAKSALDEAHKHGLTVMVGIWLPHERHGFDYSDEWAVKDQLKAVEKAVLEFKDHPALLLWGIGNEVDLFYTDFNVWSAVENLAAMIHELDPNHPTCTVTAGIDVAEVQLIKKYAPSIDILGVNTYGGINVVPEAIDLYGWEKPYIITEWGPNGHWEVPTTAWGAPYEQTSTEKMHSYQNRYEKYIASDKEQCIGSYVFHWGQKQETTPTWYGVFLEDGSQTGAIDAIYRAWKGKDPPNQAPLINSMTVNGTPLGKDVYLRRGAKNNVVADIVDPDGDEMTVNWEFLPESQFTKSGGDREIRPESLEGLVIRTNGGEMTFRSPSRPGAYRLFIYVHDPYGKVATANTPFLVE